jgi:hypothetical protein
MKDFSIEANALLTEDAEEATCFCHYCGRMYCERPFLCLCKSNVFLQPKPPRQKEVKE